MIKPIRCVAVHGIKSFLMNNDTSTCLIFVILFMVTVSSCTMNEPEFRYIDRKYQDNYPSGSTISYLAGNLYIMGDDASELLVLNHDLEEIERIPFFPKGENIRTAKALKADIESSSIIRYQGKEAILFLGSGSFSPHRDSAFLFDPENKKVRRLDFKSFYNQLRSNFRQLNIEAATVAGKEILLGIRANSSYPDNYLGVASLDIESPQFKRMIHIKVPLTHVGISGMEYDEKKDRLFITFSSEDTSNAFDDGTIGDSFLAIVEDVKKELMKDELNINSITRLTDISQDFLKQKIESVSLVPGKDQLLLVADDDLGNTTLFRLSYK